MIYYDVELKNNYFAVGTSAKRIFRRVSTAHSYKLTDSCDMFCIPGITFEQIDFKILLIGEYIIRVPYK